jgi:hypothetical protein
LRARRWRFSTSPPSQFHSTTLLPCAIVLAVSRATSPIHATHCHQYLPSVLPVRLIPSGRAWDAYSGLGREGRFCSNDLSSWPASKASSLDPASRLCSLSLPSSSPGPCRRVHTPDVVVGCRLCRHSHHSIEGGRRSASHLDPAFRLCSLSLSPSPHGPSALLYPWCAHGVAFGDVLTYHRGWIRLDRQYPISLLQVVLALTLPSWFTGAPIFGSIGDTPSPSFRSCSLSLASSPHRPSALLHPWCARGVAFGDILTYHRGWIRLDWRYPISPRSCLLSLAPSPHGPSALLCPWCDCGMSTLPSLLPSH